MFTDWQSIVCHQLKNCGLGVVIIITLSFYCLVQFSGLYAWSSHWFYIWNSQSLLLLHSTHNLQAVCLKNWLIVVWGTDADWVLMYFQGLIHCCGIFNFCSNLSQSFPRKWQSLNNVLTNNYFVIYCRIDL